MESGIYIITNLESGKVYIGSTAQRFQKRWGQHLYVLRRGACNNTHLQRAWNKYGEDAFEFGILEYVDDPKELHLAEQFWVDVYQEEGTELYNIATIGPAPWLGRRHTAETKLKMSKAAMGRRYSDETRRRMSEASKLRTGRLVSEETRRKISATLMGHPVSQETRLKWSKPYPAFIHQETGEVIPAGVNLTGLCRERGLTQRNMWAVVAGKRRICQGWILLKEVS